MSVILMTVSVLQSIDITREKFDADHLGLEMLKNDIITS